MTGPRVFDGFEWHDVEKNVGHTGSQAPVPPVKNGDGTIFVSIPSFRGKCVLMALLTFVTEVYTEQLFLSLLSRRGTMCQNNKIHF